LRQRRHPNGKRYWKLKKRERKPGGCVRGPTRDGRGNIHTREERPIRGGTLEETGGKDPRQQQKGGGGGKREKGKDGQFTELRKGLKKKEKGKQPRTEQKGKYS